MNEIQRIKDEPRGEKAVFVKLNRDVLPKMRNQLD